MPYTPSVCGFPNYFCSMLDDEDRNRSYANAIKGCIDDFKKRENRAPRVLDVGVGTGMLSGLCIFHGAKHVTGVDVNPTMTSLAKESLRKVDPTGKKFTVKLVKPGASQLGEAKFDMLVSEILGTLTTSESMYKYIAIYQHHLNTFGDEQRVYCVPRKTVQYFAVHSFDRAELGHSLSSALEHAVSSTEAARKLVPTNEGGLGLHLPQYQSEAIGERLAIHTETYDRLSPNPLNGKLAFGVEGLGQTVQLESAHLGAAETRLNLGIFEWEVEVTRACI